MGYRIYQWASGTVGRHAAAEACRRDGLDLVGLHVRSADKIGKDVGGLIGMAPLGIAATGDIQAILDSDADLVIHAPLASLVYGDNEDQDIEDICALLAGGKNVITVVGYMYPKVHGPELVSRLEAACRTGGSTFHSTGLNPGWMGDLLPLTMSAMSRNITSITIREISNFQYYPSPEIMFESMGFGSTLEVFERDGARRRKWLNGLFAESIQLVADGIGLALDQIADEMTLEGAPADLETASGTVRAGTVAGQRWQWSGQVAGEKRIIHETVWRMHETVAPDWPTGNHSIVIEGEPRMYLEMAPDWISDGLLATAMHAVNATPYVCDAEPGIKTFLDLPWIFYKGG